MRDPSIQTYQPSLMKSMGEHARGEHLSLADKERTPRHHANIPRRIKPHRAKARARDRIGGCRVEKVTA